MINIINHTLNMDLANKINMNSPINIKQNDTNSHKFVINLFNSSVSHDLTGTTSRIYFKKSDGTKVFLDCILDSSVNNKLSVLLTTQVLTAIGSVACEITIYGTGGEIQTSFTFNFNVLENIRDDIAIESVSEFTALTNALAVVTTIANKADKTYVDTNLDIVNSQLADITKLITNYNSLVIDGDWSLAIQKAVDDSVENQEINFPNGNYLFSDINITKPIKITGKGNLIKSDTTKKLFNVNFEPSYSFIWNKFEIKDVIVDGNEQAVMGEVDISVNNGCFIAKNVQFKNCSKTNIKINGNVHSATIEGCKFYNGIKSGFGSIDEQHSFHIRNDSMAKLKVINCDFETDIQYIQNIQRSPIAIFSTNATNALITNNRLTNAGHIDMYSKNNKAIILGNIIRKCHWTPIKVQESDNVIISNNVIEEQLSNESAMVIQGYPRASSYGSLERGQYYGVVSGNIINNCYGGIVINGNPLTDEVTLRDATITQDDLIVKGYEITGNIIKNISLPAISLARVADINIHSNVIENWGLASNTPSYNTSAITLHRVTGFLTIVLNTIKGNGNTTSHAIATNYDGITEVQPCVLTIENNYTDGTKNYPYFLRYIDCLSLKYNYIKDDFTSLIYAKNMNRAIIKDNEGFDVGNVNKFVIADIIELITDRNMKMRNTTWGTSIPTTGSYRVGDIVNNAYPSNGEYIGWVCTGVGTPGTWKGFGLIQT